MKFSDNILPPGDMENNGHIPDTECACGPSLHMHEGKVYLVHKSSDNREIWMGVEMLLGYTCVEHVMPVQQPYVSGLPHIHIKLPDPHFEYDHNKIDPR